MTVATPPPRPPAGEPHRLFFPVGAVFAIAGVAPWPAFALGLGGWPGELHARLMVQGFELAFIAGFLLTFLPRVTRTPDVVRPAETAAVMLLVLACGAAAWVGAVALAEAAFVLALVVLAAIFVDRMRRRRNDPPEEVFFVPLGIALGIAGGLVQLAAAVGGIAEPAPRFGLRLVSLGMVLAIVLGVGAMLVPTFVGIKDPLVIPRISGPHERGMRRLFYALLAQLLVAAFVLEALGLPGAGAGTRAAVAWILLLWVWKLWRLPTRAGALGWLLWSAGLLVGIGLAGAALWPAHATGLQHLTLLGGYGCLTLGIATRVAVTHGGHGVEAEATILDPPLLALLAVALGTRIAAEFAGGLASSWLLVSGVAWCLAWLAWIVRAWSRLRPLGP